MKFPLTKYLNDYKEPDFLIEHIDLHIDLYETHTIVRSIMKIERISDYRNQKKALILDGIDLELISISMDGVELKKGDYEQTREHIIIFNVPIEFVLKIQTKINPHDNTSLSGMYVSGDIVCTQCEAEGFQKITYFLDRPDVLSHYTCTIEADHKKYPVLLSNGNLIQYGTYLNGRHWVTWEDPFPKPSYLFAIVAGDLEFIEDYFITQSDQEVTLRIFAEKENIDRCGHAMEALKKAMEWDEENFDREYDLEMYMIVAINDFNMGAMENKGLNIFNAKYILANPETATDNDFFDIERVIAHEYFHNWTGNRITLKNWFQLCLKEGLTVFRDQLFAEDMAASRAIKRIQDVQKLRLNQFPEDDGPMAHPVRPDAYIEMNNFYTMTVYEKGAEVIRMLYRLLGDNFYKGMDYYFIHFDGKAVTVEDFLDSMEDADERDLTHFKLWYTQAGTPTVVVEREYNSETKTYRLSFEQSCQPTPDQPEKKSLLIPVDIALIDSNGQSIPLQLIDEEMPSESNHRVLEFDDKYKSFEFINVPEEPVPSIFRDFSACVKVSMDYTFKERLFLMTYDSDDFNRWDQGRQIFLEELCRLVIMYQEERPMTLNQEILGVLETILCSPITDKALTSELLKLPSEVEIAHYTFDKIQTIHPDAIYHARRFMKQSISISLSNTFFSVYKDNRTIRPYSIDPEFVSERSLKNIALDYLVNLKQSEVLSFALEQYTKADNMTDAFSALKSLSHIKCKEFQTVRELFYEKWQHDPLVIDKWFSVQAMSSLEDTLITVKDLLRHKDFTLKNPNRVRSLLGSFAHNNHYHFHSASGEGYKLLSDQVIKLDKKNPQIASRLVSAFNHWKKYDDKRQALISNQLEHIITQKSLSKDVYEIVSKALG
ncbi:aminopeptidase N [Candidatus Magnetomorum sp. HK-1]|nr:aminopeptidase N [Candidatus Magnetomorum sp. HK-1]